MGLGPISAANMPTTSSTTFAASDPTGRPLVDLLAENEEVAKHLDRAALEKLCDPAKLSRPGRRNGGRVLAGREKNR